MNKYITLFIVVAFLATGCKKTSPTGYTVLGDYTPWENIPEKMNGKVDKLIERVYWGEPRGDSIIQGGMLTLKKADSLGWGYSFEASYDNTGDLVSCLVFDEKNRYIHNWQFFKKGNMPDSAIGRWRDTLSVYQRLKCDGNGMLAGGEQFRSKTNEPMSSWVKKVSRSGDTIEYRTFDGKGAMTSRTVCLYNDKGQFTGSFSYDRDGAETGSLSVSYNDEGKVSGLAFYNGDRTVRDTIRRTYKYDAVGNWIRMISRNTHNEIAIYNRTYTYFQ